MREIIDGLLLGDGSLNYRPGNPNFRSLPRFGYNCKELEFVEWIVQALTGLGLTFGPIHPKPNGYGTGITHQVYSHVAVQLLPYLHRWYPAGKKILPIDISITPTVANMWYCGDGGLDSDKGYLRQIALCTHCFEPDSREWLAEQLRSLGFRSRAAKNGRVFVSKRAIPDFLNWIGQPPTSCYLYKWAHLSYTSKQPKY